MIFSHALTLTWKILTLQNYSLRMDCVHKRGERSHWRFGNQNLFWKQERKKKGMKEWIFQVRDLKNFFHSCLTKIKGMGGLKNRTSSSTWRNFSSKYCTIRRVFTACDHVLPSAAVTWLLSSSSGSASAPSTSWKAALPLELPAPAKRVVIWFVTTT